MLPALRSTSYLRLVSNTFSATPVLRLSYNHQIKHVKPLSRRACVPSLRFFSSESTTTGEPTSVSPSKEEPPKPSVAPSQSASEGSQDDEKLKKKASREAKEQKKKERKEKKDKKDKKATKEVAPQNSSLIGVYDPDQIREHNSALSEYVQKKERVKGELLFNRFFTLGLQHDLETYHLMLQLYINSNEYHNLAPLTRLLRDSTLKPTIQTYNLLMECYLNTKNYSELEYIYRKIRSEKISPDLRTLSLLLRYCLVIKDLNLALLYRTQFRYGDGYKLQNYNKECVELLFDVCLSRYEIDRAETLIQKILKIQNKPPSEERKEKEKEKEEEVDNTLAELTPEQKKKLEREKKKKKKADKPKRDILPEVLQMDLKPLYLKLKKTLLLINLNEKAAKLDEVISSLP